MGWDTFTWPDVEESPGFWGAAIFWIAVLLVLFLVFWAGLEFYGVQLREGATRRACALKLVTLVHHGFVGPAALVAISQDPVTTELFSWECWGCEDAAWLMVRDPRRGLPPAVRALTPITVGFMVFDTLLMPCWDTPEVKAKFSIYHMLFLMHHVLSAVLWPGALKYDYCARYLMVMLSFEATSIPLLLIWLIQKSRGKNLGYEVITLFYLAFFFSLRVVLAFPQLIAAFRVQPWTLSVAEKTAAPDPVEMDTWEVHTLVAVLIPHALNFFWFWKVIDEILKYLLGKSCAELICGRRRRKVEPEPSCDFVVVTLRDMSQGQDEPRK